MFSTQYFSKEGKKMHTLSKRIFKAMIVSLVPLYIVTVSGCSSTEPPRPTSKIGVLSATHQRALNAATVRAIEQAGVDEFFLGPEKIYVDVKAVGAADLGKQHVAGAVLAELDTLGAHSVNDPAQADTTVSCFIHVAGMDPSEGEFLFWKWKEVKADVELSFKKTTDQIATKKQGVGKATYNETWFLGMGPERKIK